MTTAIDAARDLITAINTRDADTLIGMLADDVVVEYVTLGQRLEGKEAVTTWFANTQKKTEADHIEITRLCEDGSAIWAERIDRHLVEGEWHEIPIMGILEMNAKGQLTLMREYFDPKLAV